MAFYQNMRPPKMSKQEHLKKDWNEGGEGSRYHEKTGAAKGYRKDAPGGAQRTGYQSSGSRTGYQGNGQRTGYQSSGPRTGYQGNGQHSGYQSSGPRPGYQGNGQHSGYQSSGTRTGYQGNTQRDGYQGENRRSGYQGSGSREGYKAAPNGYRSDRPAQTGYANNQRSENGRFTNNDRSRSFSGDRPARPEAGHAFVPRQNARPYPGTAPVTPATGRPAFRPAQPVNPPRPAAQPAVQPVEQPVAPGFDTPFSNEPENLLSGRNPIREAIKSGRDIEKLLVAKGDLSGSAREIVAMARENRIPVQVVERSRLDEITHNHQGMLAFASAYKYSDVPSMLEAAKERGEKPFLIILDGVTDPHNLGAIIRTAACVGAHGVIVPERRAVGLTPAAVKSSAGAVETIKVARVANLTRTIEMLKKEGLWIYSADMEGTDYRKVKMETPMALVIGSEGEGISRLVLEQTDYRVKLPMYGGVDSLNASVAAGILMYAAVSGRE